MLCLIQDFPEVGVTTLMGVPTYDFGKISLKCMKLKEFGPRGAHPSSPLRSAAEMVNIRCGTSKFEVGRGGGLVGGGSWAHKATPPDPHLERCYEISIETLLNRENARKRTSIFPILQVIH